MVFATNRPRGASGTTPAGNWAQNYYTDGVVGGPIPYEPTGFQAPDAPQPLKLDEDYKIAPLDTLKISVFQVPDLSGEFEAGGGSRSTLARLGQVVYTLTQFSTVDAVAARTDRHFKGQRLIALSERVHSDIGEGQQRHSATMATKQPAHLRQPTYSRMCLSASSTRDNRHGGQWCVDDR